MLKKMGLAAAALAACSCAFAQNSVVNGEITGVTTLYKTVITTTPVRECTTVEVQSAAQPDSVGGLAGGIIGNQVGKGDGNKIATAIGAVVGSQVGRNMAESNAGAPKSHLEERCTTTNREERRRVVSGYRYEYSTPYGSGVGTTNDAVSVGQSIRVRVLMKPEI